MKKRFFSLFFNFFLSHPFTFFFASCSASRERDHLFLKKI